MDETPTEASLNINAERMNKDSVSVKDIMSLSEMKIQSSDTCVNDADSKEDKRASFLLNFQNTLAGFTKREERRSLRESKRTTFRVETLLKKRGLPADKKILHSAKRKDTFDLRCLNDSLPSASENKKDFRMKNFQIPASSWKQKKYEREHAIRLAVNKHVDSLRYTNLLRPAYGSVRGSMNPHGFQLTTREQRVWSMKEHKKISAIDFQEEPDEEKSNLTFEEVLQFWGFKNCVTSCQGSPCSIGQTAGLAFFDKLDDKEPLEKTSDIENNLQKREFPPLLTTCWDAEKNWNSDLPSPRLSVPLNSPTKWKEGARKDISSMTSAELILEIQQMKLKCRREANKFRMLNSLRGVTPEEMDRIESESTSSQRNSKYNLLFRKAREFHNPQNEPTGSMRPDLRLLMRLHARSESKRNTEGRLSMRNRNSDKVIPD